MNELHFPVLLKESVIERLSQWKGKIGIGLNYI